MKTITQAAAWAHQPTHYKMAAVAGRRLRPPQRCIRHHRRNPRRLELRWLEVAVLEALAELAFIEYSWEACVKFLTSGISGESIGGSGVFRPDRLVWAAETDDLATPRLLAKAAEMQRELR